MKQGYKFNNIYKREGDHLLTLYFEFGSCGFFAPSVGQFTSDVTSIIIMYIIYCKNCLVAITVHAHTTRWPQLNTIFKPTEIIDIVIDSTYKVAIENVLLINKKTYTCIYLYYTIVAPPILAHYF